MSVPLTRRQLQVAYLIASGKTTREVADTLGIRPRTADTHRSSVYRKLNIHRTAELIRWCLKNPNTDYALIRSTFQPRVGN